MPHSRRNLQFNHSLVRKQESLGESGTFVWPRYDKPRHLRLPVSLRDSDSSEDMYHNSNDEFCRRATHTSKWRLMKEEFEDEEDWDEGLEESEEEDFDEDEQYYDRAGKVGEENGVGKDEIRFSSVVTSPSTSGSTSRSLSLSDRHIRDINILKHLAVPFSYEEVAYSSNEYFREIKSRPGLTFDQVN